MLGHGFVGDSISVEEFSYDENTLVYDFYKVLCKKYVDIGYNDAKCIEDLEYLLSFNIVDNVNSRSIGIDNGNDYLKDIIVGIEDKLLCILPSLPVGATFAAYRGIKIVIHSNEGNHVNYPHVHVINNEFETVINLDSLEIVEGVELNGKVKKKIMKYLEENQEFLIDCYNKIVGHEDVGKIEIDIID